MKRVVLILSVIFSSVGFLSAQVPSGVVVNHIPASSQKYLGSPAICMLPDGRIFVSNDYFGPKSTERDAAVTDIFVSEDGGESFTKVSSVKGQFWSSLFARNNTLYLLGTYRAHGNVVIRKSDDFGRTWSVPCHPKNGLIAEGEYHTAPVPVLEYKGRIWRAFEYATAREPVWPERYSAVVFSAPANSDLLDASNWRKSTVLPSEKPQLDGKFRGWLEGNVVYDKAGKSLVDILRVHAPSEKNEYCAKVRISSNGRKLSFTPDKDIIPFPGGSKKFTIRYDESTGKYWTLSNVTDPDSLGGIQNDRVRNRLALCCSEDLVGWTVTRVIMEHPDCLNHGFQYADWIFDGNDILAVIRTSFEDEEGQAQNYHNSNYIVFKRISCYSDENHR